MKPICIVLSPTRSRPLNMFLGIVLLLASLLLFLALASYHPADPSLNTSTDLVRRPQLDWPLRRLHHRSAPAGPWHHRVSSPPLDGRCGLDLDALAARRSPMLRWTGTLLTLAFLPAVFGLLPWHWRWLHPFPSKASAGRLMAGLLVVYLNVQGAWLVAAALAASPASTSPRPSASRPFAKACRALDHSSQPGLTAGATGARSAPNCVPKREAQRSEEAAADRFSQPRRNLPSWPTRNLPVRAHQSSFSRSFRRNRTPQQDPVDEIPAFRREPFRADRDHDSCHPARRKPSIWERSEPGPGVRRRFRTSADYAAQPPRCASPAKPALCA